MHITHEFANRADTLRAIHYERAKRELAKLNPDLGLVMPFHLAHNWHRCKKVKNATDRKICRIIDQTWAFERKISELKARHYNRLYTQWQNDTQ